MLAEHHNKHHKPTNHMDDFTTDYDVNVFNILAYGNLIAAFLMILLFSSRLHKYKRLTKKDWFFCSIGAILYSTLSNAFLYLALQETSQNNVSILTRIEPCLILTLSYLVFGEEVPRHKIIGNVIILLGVVIMFLWPLFFGDSATFGSGEFMALLSAICVSISTIISKWSLQSVPLGVFMSYRSLLGGILYLVFGIITQGDDIVNPWDPNICEGIWELMCGYGALVVICQMMWFLAIKSATSAQICVAVSAGFPTLLIFAYIVNDESPTDAQWVGASIIIFALIYTNASDYYGEVITKAPDSSIELDSYERLHPSSTQQTMTSSAGKTLRSMGDFLFDDFTAADEPACDGMRLL